MMEVITKKNVTAVEKAKICREAENDWANVPCGIMDQTTSCAGKSGHALMLDCRDLTITQVPMDDSVSVLVIDSDVRHKLVDGAYASRRSDCETAVSELSKLDPNIRALRDATVENLKKIQLPTNTAINRATHVVEENNRCLQFAKALNDKDFERAGELMKMSHKSLKDLFEVSTKEIDTLVDLASGTFGVYGARITGGGFGGCVVCLVQTEQADTILTFVLKHYQSAYPDLKPFGFVAKASEGAHVYN
eukprot:GHVL01009395.1.p1 GENE.GHVL01009395.1~~GHVL01009395.1.p1  ORF type:complete len:249 (-),score=43.48 GHVL01009395.1:185-931(-)